MGVDFHGAVTFCTLVIPSIWSSFQLQCNCCPLKLLSSSWLIEQKTWKHPIGILTLSELPKVYPLLNEPFHYFGFAYLIQMKSLSFNQSVKIFPVSIHIPNSLLCPNVQALCIYQLEFNYLSRNDEFQLFYYVSELSPVGLPSFPLLK